MAKQRKFTEDELKKIEAWAAVRVPLDHMGALLGGLSRDTMERIMTKDDAARAAFEVGRAKASANVRNTLYSRAMGHEGYVIPERKDNKGKVIFAPVVVPPQPSDFQALKFWCQTQEGFKTHDVIELAGNASAKEQLTDDELEKRTAAALARIAARKGGK